MSLQFGCNETLPHHGCQSRDRSCHRDEAGVARRGAAVARAETCRAVEKSGGKTAKLIHDLAHFRGIDDLVAEVGHTPIDLLVNNAGVAVVKPFAEITRQEWEQTIGV